MSKTFNSVNEDAKRDLLVVLEVTEGVNIHVDSPEGMCGVSIAPSDAPALAIAILETAGGRDSLGIDVGNAITDLREYVTEQERITAEAEAQAKLEAEALELYNVCMTGHNLTSFDGLGGALRDQWLAVARKAREIGAGK